MILIGVFLIILVIITVYLFSSYILNIIDQILDFANEVSKGNLTVEKLDFDTEDEFSDLADYLNEMRSNLETSINNVRNLLNNADQGFLSFGDDLLIDKEYSVMCHNIFGYDISEHKFSVIISSLSDRKKLELNLQKVFKAAKNKNSQKVEQYINNLPQQKKINGRCIDLKYKIIHNKSEVKVMVIMTDVTEKQEIKEKAIRDGLTNLYNHSYFKEILARKIEDINKFEGSLSLLMLDIDDFKLFNDNYGHQAGDEILKLLAQILENNTRKTDIVARYGGEEFTIILPGANLERAVMKAEKICNKVRDKKIEYQNKKLNITISIGVTTYNSEANDSKTKLINRADMALYQAKEEGKNRIIKKE
ncbi:GGDEF domain-containing protein [Halanaerobacter jeridensis]|uniref:Diguanylate cyclase (GGDEF)-like protein n=1 Tax=Halanaerobacter jeridensis TaxID=706427 RepID=A0A938XTC5_9FIRM|nr:diguanylate cyclase [Halanaerobacter jeridensis]MBM7556519.1 diguanylate cyclase (GGDEF)-like protein [Halanaerobacter jeridensis]